MASAEDPSEFRSVLPGMKTLVGSLLVAKEIEPPKAGLILLSVVAFWPKSRVTVLLITNSTPVLGSMSVVWLSNGDPSPAKYCVVSESSGLWTAAGRPVRVRQKAG